MSKRLINIYGLSDDFKVADFLLSPTERNVQTIENNQQNKYILRLNDCGLTGNRITKSKIKNFMTRLGFKLDRLPRFDCLRCKLPRQPQRKIDFNGTFIFTKGIESFSFVKKAGSKGTWIVSSNHTQRECGDYFITVNSMEAFKEFVKANRPSAYTVTLTYTETYTPEAYEALKRRDELDKQWAALAVRYADLAATVAKAAGLPKYF